MAKPLDALLLMVEPAYPGVRVSARVVSVFWVITGHGREARMICVPQGDRTYEGIEDLAQFPSTGWRPNAVVSRTRSQAPRGIG